MPDWATPQALIAVLLLGILVALVILVVKNGRYRIVVDESLDEALRKIQAAAANTVDIAVLTELTEQIKRNPEILQRIEEYGEVTLAAARIYAIKLLEGDLAHARRRLSTAHQSITYPSQEQRQAAITKAQAHVDHIEGELIKVVRTGRTDA